MGYEAVKERELFAGKLPMNDIGPSENKRRDRYDLAAALRIVRRMETSAGRGAVFEEVKRKNSLYRLVDTLYSLAGKRMLQPLMLWVYMLKCVLSVGPFTVRSAEVVAIANFPNEEHTIDRVAALVPDIEIHRLSIWRRHIIGRGQMVAALQVLGALRRIWPFLRTLAKTHSFMPAARIASTLAFYMRFSQMFRDVPQIMSAIIASNYSPEAVGLASAAHQFGKRVVYANHAPVPANGPVVPPVMSDCALFYGAETAHTYQRRARCSAEVALIGQPGETRKMVWPMALTRVGIFLTSGTNTKTLAELISSIREVHTEVQVLVRDHPVALLRNDLSDIVLEDPKVEMSVGKPLEEEIVACDMIICGNSGVALNALCGGRPVAYLNNLDGIIFDSNGFIASGLVFEFQRWGEDIYEQLKGFYSKPGWDTVMQSYDASYNADILALRHNAASVLIRHLRPQSC